MSVIPDTEKNQNDISTNSDAASTQEETNFSSPPVAESPAASTLAGTAPPPELPRPSPPSETSESTGPLTLAIDIGGTGIKCMLLDAKGQAIGERQRQPTPRPATPQAVLAA